MAIPRVLEEEVMDTPREAAEYDAMDHGAVNARFVADLAAAYEAAGRDFAGPGLTTVLDIGTGTALIPIELCRDRPNVLVRGTDMAREMLRLAEQNVVAAHLSDQIVLEVQDAKRTSYETGSFDVVVSNSLAHHIPEPEAMFRDLRRLAGGETFLFVRDLLRPATESELDALVETHAGDETPSQRQMFRDSLHAALTVEEVDELCRKVGLGLKAEQTSDRHWTLAGTPPAV